MITELMLILTVIGAGIIFVVWNNSRKKKQAELDRQEVEESTNEFKAELEKTANEIIGRMETQAAHLESLLDDSERNRAQLEGRVAELKKLLKRTENQSTEIRDLLERLDDAEEDVGEMQRQMDAVEKKINAAINVQIPQQSILNNVPQIVTPPLMNPLMQPPQMTQPAQPVVTPMQTPIVQPPQIVRTPPPPPVEKPAEKIPEEKKPQEDFSKVLEQSMQEENSKVPKVPLPPDRSSIVLSREIKQPVKLVDAEPVKIDPSRQVSGTIAERQARVLAERKNKSAEKNLQKKSEAIRKAAVAAINSASGNEITIEVPKENSIPNPAGRLQELKKRAENISEKKLETSESVSIREMLLSGMTVEEIARETGLGRGAIELVQQMTKKQLERK